MKLFSISLLIIISCLIYIISQGDNDEHSRPVTKTYVAAKLFSKPKAQMRAPASIVEAKSPVDPRVQSSVAALEQLSQVEACYTEQSCNFPDSDPREYDLMVGKKLKGQLMELYDNALDNKVDEIQLSNIAHHYIQLPDGHVKEGALMLFSTIPPNEDNLEAILKNIVAYHDANLMKKALIELQRYLDNPSWGALIFNSFRQCLLNGSHFASKQLAKSVGPFLNDQNIGLYENLLDHLSAGKQTKQLLADSIKKYKKYQSGG
ncbi:MAG: hypothetical protein ISR65_03665 [Bacteriovoracaceae bacterium]|nr:hypothetical protein [Bacteriovoracaceae bacterium]